MREIKFRAWDRQTKRMFDPYLIESSEKLCWGEMLDQHEKGNVILMQYTGLHDDNGTSIYEMDIIEFYKDTPFLVIWSQDYGKLMYSNRDEKGIGGLTKSSSKRCKVLGNIYENPELLK